MNYILQVLVLSACLLSALSQQQTTTTTTVITSNAQNYAFPNGGLNTNFAIGPTNFIISGIQGAFNIILVPSQTATFYLTGGLLDIDYNIYPLVGFQKNYQLNGAPNWINFDNVNNILTASPLQNWQGPTFFNITYSDSRPNSISVTIPVTFNRGNIMSINQVAYTSTNPFAIVPNTYTIVYPLFTTTTSNINSIRTNNFGVLSNVGTRPWTSLEPVRRQAVQLPINNQIFNPPVNTVVVTNTTNITGIPNPFFNQNTNLNQNQGQVQTQTTTTTQQFVNQSNVNSAILPNTQIQGAQGVTTTQVTYPNGTTQWNQQPAQFGTNNFLFSTPNPNEAAIINRTQTTVTTNAIPSSQTTVSPVAVVSNIPAGQLNSTTTTTTITGSPSVIQNLQQNLAAAGTSNLNTVQFPVSNQTAFTFNSQSAVTPQIINQNSVLASNQGTTVFST